MIQGLAKRLQIARINKELSRKQTAELIDVSESLIGLYESGSRQPSLSVLMKLASLYLSLYPSPSPRARGCWRMPWCA